MKGARLATICCTVYGPDASPTGFDVLAPLWNALLERARFNSFFLTHEWQTIWWHSLGVGELWILAFSDESTDELVGIAPLYCITPEHGASIGKTTLTLVGCTEVSDYLDVIIAQGWEEAVYQAFCSWLYSDDAPDWQRLDLCNLPEDSLTYQHFPQMLGETPQGGSATIDVSLEDVAPYFLLPSTYETYLQEQVNKKHRHEMRRKMRRIEREAECEFYIIGQDGFTLEQRKRDQRKRQEGSENDQFCADFEPAMDEFLRLQMASRDDKAEFMTDEMAQFFRTMACYMQQAGYLRLCFLRIDGVNAATLMAFEYDGRFWLYNSGYDPEIFASLSPGWVILSYTIQYTIAAGLKVYDFMQGDEEYKYRFGGQDYKVMRVIVER